MKIIDQIPAANTGAKIKRLLFLLLMGASCLLEAQTIHEFPRLKGEYLGQNPPGCIPEVFAPGIVSDTSWRAHCQIAISLDGDEIYWSRFTPGVYEQIYFSKLKNGLWSEPAIVDFNIGDTIINGGPIFSPDGNRLFFYSRNRSEGKGYIDAWYVERVEDGWSKPINFGEPINSAGDDRPPIITEHGNAYCIPKKIPIENGEIIRFKYSNGVFSDPSPFVISKDFNPWWPLFVSPDESYIIFPSYTEDGFGRLDLYISFKDKNDCWGYPVNMGDKINTSLTERFPVVSPDGNYLFFMRQTETWDIFWVSTDVIKELKKQ